MRRVKRWTVVVFLCFGLVGGCAGSDDAEESADGMQDSGIEAGKADGPFSGCELNRVVALANDPATDYDFLRGIGVHKRAAENIIAHRDGPDAVAGTEDDNLFDDVEELDDVYYVGPAAFRDLVAHVTAACASAEQGDAVEVIFSPQPYESSHLARVAQLIDGAERSIDVAMYSFSDGAIKAAIYNAAARGVSVRMVLEAAKGDHNEPEGTSSAKLEDAGVDVRYINKIMHHKFAIIDGPRNDTAEAHGATLITGSANWSSSAGTRYDENTVFLRGHTEPVLRFQSEFNLMWNYSRDFEWNTALEWFASVAIELATIADDPNFDTVFTSANFDLKQTSYGATFSVVAGRNTVSDKLVEMIMGAESTIWVASGHLRSRPVAEALIAKAAASPDVDIKVYLDSQEFISSYYHDKQLKTLDKCLEAAGDSTSKQQKCTDKGFLFGRALHLAGVATRYKYYAYRWHYSYAPQMHHKYLLIDDTLASGSYNLSDNAEHNTLENVAMYDAAGFPELVESFRTNFQTMWVTGQDEGLLGDLVDTIESATDSFPIVFAPMALDWDQVAELKAAIKANCPAINSDDYRKNPQAHQYCNL